jgi:isoquinoline 1-oxidoreductase beta subunit
MSEILNVSRRDFLKTGATIGGGLMLGFSLPDHLAFGQASGQSGGSSMLNAFIRISSDETITIVVNHSEMGQGVYTSLPMLVAEELECDWSKIVVEASPVDPAYNHTQWGIQGTAAPVFQANGAFAKVGASAREMIIAAAADMWKVDKASCRAENGKVVHSSGKSMTYGQLATKAANMPVPKEIQLKRPSKFKIIGKPVKRLDTPEKTNGKGVFGIDVTIPGMLIAVVERPPVFGGKVVSLKADKAIAVPGVKDVVQVPSGIAVVASGFWPAKVGRDALEIVWDDGPNATLSTESMREQYANLSKTPGTVGRKEGDPQKLFRRL